jgi:hypothetical protein
MKGMAKKWIEETVGENFSDPSSLWNSLKSGVLLCKYLTLLF